jgi:hypothetical protein
MTAKFMQFTGILLLAASPVVVACNDDHVEDVCARKGEIDRSALEPGVTATVVDDIGTVELLFLVPVPDHGDDAELQAELSSAVSLVVTSDETGATADLISGTIVDSVPAAPGEWAWELDGDRNVATLTFFNAAAGGTALDVSATYGAALSIAFNEYIEEEPLFAFTVAVEEE